MVPKPAQCWLRRLAVAKTRGDGNCVPKCLGDTLRAQAAAFGVKANFVLGVILGGAQSDTNPESAVIPKSEIDRRAVRCAGPDCQSFQALTFVLASIDLNAEGPERMTRRETPTEFDGCVVQPLGPAQRDFAIVRHCRVQAQRCCSGTARQGRLIWHRSTTAPLPEAAWLNCHQ